MAAFLETLARRGAGLGSGTDVALAAPRPRMRFEPDAGSATGSGDTPLLPDVAQEASTDAPAVDHARSTQLTRTGPGDTRRYSPEIPGNDPLSAGTDPKSAPAPADPVNETRMALPPIGLPQRSVRVTPSISSPPLSPALPETTVRDAPRSGGEPAHGAAGEETDEPPLDARPGPAQSRDHTVVVESAPEAGRPRQDLEGVSVRPRMSAVEPVRNEVFPSTIGQIRDPIPGPARPSEPGARHENPHTVSVSIGRIEVEVAPPPTPAAPAHRAQPERTRGFAAYRNARRGRPR